MAKDSAESKVEAPGTMVTVSLPALMMSLFNVRGGEDVWVTGTYASISSFVGYGP